jgi:excisionase family DNA binding protein
MELGKRPQKPKLDTTYRSVAELADEIGLSERSTRSALRRGEIPHIRIGRRFILPKAAISEWLRSAGRGRDVFGDQGLRLASTDGQEVTVMRRQDMPN